MLRNATGPRPGLAGFDAEHVASAADEHYDAFPDHSEPDLARSLHADLERRYASEPENHDGYAKARAVLQEALAAGVLARDFHGNFD